MPVALSIRFRPTAEQSEALERLLDEQQNPSSPQFHSWLTPEEFGELFGLSPDDLTKVSGWLEAQGFQVEAVAKSRTYITFNATAGQVRNTFKTELHRYRAEGDSHFANAGDLEVPEALAPLLTAVRGMDDFRIESHPRPRPMATGGGGGRGLGPGDLATIYNLKPLWQRGIDGTGQKIAVVGRSQVNLADIQTFRANFNLPKNDPQIIQVPGKPVPGYTNSFSEAVLDIEWAGSSAPGATILYIYSQDIWDAVQYAVDQNLAPVLSYSFSGCEQAYTTGNWLSFDRSIAQQANAQGITWVAASGDAGAAGCETQQLDVAGVSGVWVNVPASFPEVTGVGGTEFSEGNGSYWSTTNSALSYIPETAWNDSWGTGGLAATGGGASSFFTKPSWQTGPGVPAYDARWVPDVAYSASWDHDPILIFETGAYVNTGGTSAATPFFAGILALLNQHVVNSGIAQRPGLGNINPRLYQMAQTTTGVFHDIVTGSNIVPCKTGTTGCTSDPYGYSATPGYDPVTGLGSLNVANFVDNWAGKPSTPTVANTTTTVAANPSAIAANGTTLLKATVKAATGSELPNGPVYFSVGDKNLGSADLANSGGVATASFTVNGAQLAAGANTITAWYGGASDFLSSTGTTTVTVPGSTNSKPSVVVPSVDPSPVYRKAPDADGYAFFFTLRLAETAGTPTTLTGFTMDGYDYSAQIAAFFGSANVPASGTLSAAVRFKDRDVPAGIAITLSGSDPSGQKWSRQLTVSFFGDQTAPGAGMALASVPETVLQSTKADANCDANHPYSQLLILQETGGTGVRLNKFIAGGNDFSDQIQNWFGSLRLPPYGVLYAHICWQLGGVPVTLDYEVAGVDQSGQPVDATLEVAFQPPAASPGALSVSKNAIDFSAGPASIDISLPSGEQWTAAAFVQNQKTSWLTVTPASGNGPAHVNLTASATRLVPGVYNATLVIQALNTAPQYIMVPVSFTIGRASDMSISAAVNAASFQKVFAPGMLMSLSGTHLSITTKTADSGPLPARLENVTVTVNGIPAPLAYVSPGQINLQIPFEAPIGPAVVAVNNNGRVTSTVITLDATAPGIFTKNGALTPTASARRGTSVVLYLTGDGETDPMLDTGAPPAADTPAGQLPKPRAPLMVTVGGVKADVSFAGNPGLVGVTQVTFTVPANTPAGSQPVVVTVSGVASAPATLNVE